MSHAISSRRARPGLPPRAPCPPVVRPDLPSRASTLPLPSPTRPVHQRRARAGLVRRRHARTVCPPPSLSSPPILSFPRPPSLPPLFAGIFLSLHGAPNPSSPPPPSPASFAPPPPSPLITSASYTPPPLFSPPYPSPSSSPLPLHSPPHLTLSSASLLSSTTAAGCRLCFVILLIKTYPSSPSAPSPSSSSLLSLHSPPHLILSSASLSSLLQLRLVAGLAL
ncbi:unnamed protein product [Closterium sp. Naga37s-1]|nr:unnamed protein product [Closterium sp. Naga37s-1]